MSRHRVAIMPSAGSGPRWSCSCGQADGTAVSTDGAISAAARHIDTQHRIAALARGAWLDNGPTLHRTRAAEILVAVAVAVALVAAMSVGAARVQRDRDDRCRNGITAACRRGVTP